MRKPELDWTGDFETDMKTLNEYETWYAYRAHSMSIHDLTAIIYKMIWTPLDPLPEMEDEEWFEEEQEPYGWGKQF